MSDLGKEHLAELTALINERLQEFRVTTMPTIAPGVVRAAHDVIKRWYQEKEESWATQRISEVTITAEMAMKLSKQGYEMGYEAAKREPSPIPNQDQIRADIRDLGAAYPSLEDQPNGADVFAGVHPVTGLPEPAPEPPVMVSRMPVMVSPVVHEPAYVIESPPAPEPITDADRQWAVETAQGLGVLPDATGNGHHTEPVSLPPARTPLPDPDVAREKLAQALATGSAGNLVRAGSNGHAEAVPPLVPRRTPPVATPEPKVTPVVTGKPRTLAEVDNEALQTSRMTADERSADLRQTLYALEDMAEDGWMPTAAEWDKRRPKEMLTAQGIQYRHNLSWGELAARAKLKLRQGRR